jgi:hypothetical protein
MKAHKQVDLGNQLRDQLDNHISIQLHSHLDNQIDTQLENHIYNIFLIEISEQLRGQCMNEIHRHL